MIISEKVTLHHLCIREEDGDVCPDNCFGRKLLSPLWGFPTHLGTDDEAFLLRGHPDSVTVPSSPCPLRPPQELWQSREQNLLDFLCPPSSSPVCLGKTSRSSAALCPTMVCLAPLALYLRQC